MGNPYESPQAPPDPAGTADVAGSRNVWFSVRIVAALATTMAFLPLAHTVRTWDRPLWKAVAGPLAFQAPVEDFWFYAFLGALVCFAGVGTFVFWPRRSTAIVAVLSIAVWAGIGQLA